MSALKVIASLFLGLLLFICLLVMGPAVALKATVLNTGFVNSRLSSLDVAEMLRGELPDLESSQYSPGSVQAAFLAHTEELQQAAVQVVTATHRYLVNGGAFDLTKTVRDSLFKPELGISILADMDFGPAAREALKEIAPADIGGYDSAPYLEVAVPAVESWFKGEIEELLIPAYDYLLSTSPGFTTVEIPLGDIAREVRLAVKEAFLSSPPSELSGVPPLMLESDFDEWWPAENEDDPMVLVIDLNEALGAPGGVAKTLGEMDKALREARPWVERYQIGFIALMALTVLLILAIVAINRRVVSSCLSVGLPFTLAGLISLGVGLLGQHFGQRMLTSSGATSVLESFFLRLLGDFFRPLLIFAIICIVIGLALLIAGPIFRRRERIS